MVGGSKQLFGDRCCFSRIVHSMCTVHADLKDIANVATMWSLNTPGFCRVRFSFTKQSIVFKSGMYRVTRA